MKKRYLALVFGVLMVLIVGLVASFRSLTFYYRDSTFDFLQKQARLVGRNVEGRGFEFEESLRYVVTTGRLDRFLHAGDDDVSVTDVIKRFYAKHQDLIAFIEVYDGVSSRTVTRGKDNYFQVSSVSRNTQPRSLVSHPEIKSGSPWSFYIFPIYNSAGEVVADMRIALDLARGLRQQLLNYYIGQDAWIWCLDSSGRVVTVLYSGGRNRSLENFRATNWETIREDLSRQLEGTLEHAVEAGGQVRVLSAYYPVSLFGMEMGVVLSMSREVLFGVVAFRIAVISIFFIAITLWVALVFSVAIFRIRTAEKKLAESEERWQFALEGSGDGVWDWDFATNQVFFSRKWKGMLGYEDDELRNEFSEWAGRVHPDDLERTMRDVELYKTGKTPVYVNEHRVLAKDGTYRHILARGIVIRSVHNGQPYRMVGTHTDITEIKKAAEALKSAKEQAEKALAVKDEFTSTVSHELRTPLAAMKSSIDILYSEVPGQLAEEQKLFLRRVKSNIDRLARLINEVLDLSKLESGRMVMNRAPLRAEALVQEVVEAQSVYIRNKGLYIDTVLGESLPTLLADRDRLIQVLNNLINNALKFTSEGGITVGVSAEDAKGLTFFVRDTGIGIRAEDTAKLFEKFYQVGGASRQVGGTGLGLAISREIVTRHGGKIWVESEYGKGSVFFFTIPLAGKAKVWLAEEDREAQEAVRRILEESGLYEVCIVSNGGPDWQKPDPDLRMLMIGIDMMDQNALVICRELRNDPAWSHVRMLVLSASGSGQDEQAFRQAGVDEAISKPVDPADLLSKLARLIG
ncbi:MAG: PAS domain-containing protein [Candidatus Omnitrophica bacterium]|nr:PAS domain-containing protein [Candidatus Omnitrophota bacterium]